MAGYPTINVPGARTQWEPPDKKVNWWENPQIPPYMQQAFGKYYQQNPNGAGVTRPNGLQANANGNVQGRLGTGGASGGASSWWQQLLGSNLNPMVAANNLRQNMTQGTGQAGQGQLNSQMSSLYSPEGTTSYQGQPDQYQGGQVAFNNGRLNATMGQGNPGGSAAQLSGGQLAISPIERVNKELDGRLGPGWSAKFTAQNGASPLEFYGRAFSHIQDLGARESAAKEAAYNDARFQSGAIDEWRKVHGAQDIPEEQWQRWWDIAQKNNGNPIYGAGVGINPWGVY